MKTIIYFLFAICISFNLNASNDKIKGNGQLKAETRQVSAFSEIHISHAVKLVITQEDKYLLKIEGDENLIPYVEISEKGNALYVGMKNAYDYDFEKEMTVYVSCKDLTAIQASGASQIESKSLIKGKNFEIHSSGASGIVLNLEVSELEGVVNGASHIILNGRSGKTTITLNGASDLRASEFVSADVVLKCSGACKAFVNATKSLDIQASGASNVKYTGPATNIKKDVSGVSTIKNVNSAP